MASICWSLLLIKSCLKAEVWKPTGAKNTQLEWETIRWTHIVALHLNSPKPDAETVFVRRLWLYFVVMRIMKDPQENVKEYVKRLTSLRGSPHDICCCSSFCSSFRAPIDCWFLTKSESSLIPASVKYLAKCSQLRLFAGNNSWKKCP